MDYVIRGVTFAETCNFILYLCDFSGPTQDSQFDFDLNFSLPTQTTEASQLDLQVVSCRIFLSFSLISGHFVNKLKSCQLMLLPIVSRFIRLSQ